LDTWVILLWLLFVIIIIHRHPCKQFFVDLESIRNEQETIAASFRNVTGHKVTKIAIENLSAEWLDAFFDQQEPGMLCISKWMHYKNK